MESLKLQVNEAMQDDVNKGIIRIDSKLMRSIGVNPGNIVEIKGQRTTVAIADRSLPGDIGLNIIRMDGLVRRNAKTSIGETVDVIRSDVKEAKKVNIAPARKGIMIRANPEIFKQGLLGRAAIKGDIVSLGGTRRRRTTMADHPFFDEMFSMLDDTMVGLGFSDIKFVVVDTNPKGPVLITENTIIDFNPEAVELKEEKILEVTYEDVGGLDEEIKKIREMVELPLKHPEIFERLGIEAPKGVLLHGPPGTGKTLIAKAVANETNSNFIVINGPEIMSKFYGESEQNLRKKFEEAEKNAPSIIFIDEIDAIASKREESKGEVERRVVAQLLAIMDGLESRGKVVVIAATNIPNSLDPALRRPGRFDREIEIGVPGKQGRLKVLKIHTRNMPIEGTWYDDIAAVELMAKAERTIIDQTNNKQNMDIQKKENEKAKQEQETEIPKVEKEISELQVKIKKDFEEKVKKRKPEISTLEIEIAALESDIQKLSVHKGTASLDVAQEINSKITELRDKISKLKNNKQIIESEINREQRNIWEESSRLDALTNNFKQMTSEINALTEKIKDNDEQILSSEKKVKSVTKIKLLFESRKDKLREIIPELREIEHDKELLSSNDPRQVFIERNSKIKHVELMNLIAELVEDTVVNQEFFLIVRNKGRDKDLDSIAQITHGFVGADLSALAKEAAMILLRKVLPDMMLKEEEVIPKEILEKLYLTKNDFKEALKVVRPSALREVLIETPNVQWTDIGGLEDVKQELKEAVEWPLKHPEGFKRLGVRPPRGILLYGAPGTGKTMLAKAVAKESEANFILVKGPEMLSKWVGESEKAVRKIFEKARQASPAIVFFDEIDSIAPRRGISSDSHVTERVVNQLLTEMDGLNELGDVVLVAATNRPDILDSALLRPGRFDRIILCPVPDAATRKKIFELHTKSMPLNTKDDKVEIARLVEKTEGYVGADIESICREAAIMTLRDNKKAKIVPMRFFEKALEKVRPSASPDIQKSYEDLEKVFRRAKAAELERDKPSYYG